MLDRPLTNGPRRAAIYSRFSTDLQNPLSVADQEALCRDYARREGIHVITTYSDAGISGASTKNRPGVLDMLADAKAGKFDVIVVEELDRISRDLEDLAGIYKRLSFQGVELVSVHSGTANTIMVALRGLLGQTYREDGARKVRRGMSGLVSRGKTAGGKIFGYQPDPLNKGIPVIVEEEAEIIRRVFHEYSDGLSPRDICARLNGEHVKPPRGSLWAASSLYGNKDRAAGILRNPLYDGKIVWNRVTTTKDPSTGKRVSRLNPESEWQTADAEHLRIVPADLFDLVQRQLNDRAYAERVNPHVHRRPRHLLSGILRCGACGANMSVQGTSKSGRTRLYCSQHINNHACPAPRMHYLDTTEELLIDSLTRELAHPEQIAAYAAAWAQRVNASADDDNRRRKQIEKRLAEIEKTNTKMTDMLIAELGDAAVINRRIKEQAAERADLNAELQLIAPATNIAVHPAAITKVASQLQASRAKRELVVAELKDTGQLQRMIHELVDHIALSKDDAGRPHMEVTCRFEPLLSEHAPAFPRGWGVVSIATGFRPELRQNRKLVHP